jgi:retron-type reverse transcriptase
LAREAPQRVLTALAHHIDVAFLREAFRRTRKDGAPGMDGQTAARYAETLDTNLASLLDRLKSGTYIAPPVRRAYVPKEEGGAVRPIGVPTFEDKVLQRAIAMVLYFARDKMKLLSTSGKSEAAQSTSTRRFANAQAGV